MAANLSLFKDMAANSSIGCRDLKRQISLLVVAMISACELAGMEVLTVA